MPAILFFFIRYSHFLLNHKFDDLFICRNFYLSHIGGKQVNRFAFLERISTISAIEIESLYTSTSRQFVQAVSVETKKKKLKCTAIWEREEGKENVLMLNLQTSMHFNLSRPHI